MIDSKKLIMNCKTTIPFIDAQSSTKDVKEFYDKIGIDTLDLTYEDDINIAIEDNDSLAFCLAGSDLGIKSSIRFNQSLGLMPDKGFEIETYYKKSYQQSAIDTLNPNLSLKSKSFDSIEGLATYLKTISSNTFVRPDVSTVSGSAILIKPGEVIPLPELELMFSLGPYVNTHTEIKGTPYFFNCIAINGDIFFTDCWECITLDVNNRRILTSVINADPYDHKFNVSRREIIDLCNKLGIRLGPIHVELLIEKDNIKVVKLLPRLAREPLPTLCKLLGIDGQLTYTKSLLNRNFMSSPHHSFIKQHNEYFVADYSFVVHKPGKLIGLPKCDEITSLDSYTGILEEPKLGQDLLRTVCGSTYGATYLFKNRSKEALLKDLELCQRINEQNYFEIHS